MIIVTTDAQIVGETESTLWSTIQQGPADFLLIIKNTGTNTMNYRLQENDGSDWVDMGSSGTDFYDTLTSNEVKNFKVESTYPNVRMVGNASGGARLEFTLTRYVNRSSGGAVPILSL